MKKTAMATLVLALAGALLAGNALAAGSTDLTVSATVVGTCSFGAATYAMNFDAISVSDTGPQTATTNLQFTCTNNTPYTIDDISGPRNLSQSGQTDLPYSIAAYTTSATTTSGSAQTLTLTGTIAEADYQAAAAGTYTETVTINITP